MLSNQAKQIAIDSKKLNDNQLREKLESSVRGKYVCIEPKSGDDFVGTSTKP